MRYSLCHVMALITVVSLCGCRAHLVKKHSVGAREALMDMYTEQVMTNLIRARNHLPFVQVAYHGILVQEGENANGSFGIMQSANTVHNVSRAISKGFTIGGGAGRMGLTSFKAEPVTDQNDIYEAYLEFAQNPYQLVVTAEPPPCPVHLSRKWHGMYYWIPQDAAPAFLELYLKTTAMRGPETQPPGYYAVKIEKAEAGKSFELKDPRTKTAHRFAVATLTFDKAVPNGHASLVVEFLNRKVRFELLPPMTKSKGDNPPGKMVKEGFQVQYREDLVPIRPGQLEGLEARVYSWDYPPELPTETSTVRRILDQVDRIQANQLFTPPLPLP